MIPDARAQADVVASGFVLHFVAYTCITFLLVTGSRRSRAGRSAQAVLLVLVLGALDEYVQSFFPYRHAALGDWVVDACASLVTATLLLACHPMVRERLVSIAPAAESGHMRR